MKTPKSLYMEFTKIESPKTVSEIQEILGKYGANAILTQYENNEVSAVSFRIAINGQDIPFRLPCRWKAIYELLMSKSKRKHGNTNLMQQSKRVAWRQIYRWIQAQFALINTDMVTIQEVFLPYIQTNTAGQTFYEQLEESKFKMLEKP